MKSTNPNINNKQIKSAIAMQWWL